MSEKTDTENFAIKNFKLKYQNVNIRFFQKQSFTPFRMQSQASFFPFFQTQFITMNA